MRARVLLGGREGGRSAAFDGRDALVARFAGGEPLLLAALGVRGPAVRPPGIAAAQRRRDRVAPLRSEVNNSQ